MVRVNADQVCVIVVLQSLARLFDSFLSEIWMTLSKTISSLCSLLESMLQISPDQFTLISRCGKTVYV